MDSPRLKRIVKTHSIIVGIAIFALCVRMVKNELFGMKMQMIIFIASIIILSLSWEFLRFININLNKLYPFDKSIPVRITLQIAIGIVFIIFIRFLIFKFGEPLLSFKLDSLFLAATWILYIQISVAVNLILFTDYFIHEWKDSIRKTERLEKEKTQVQFDNLKNQLNPHFLFNALTSLNSLILEDQQLASRFLQHMSKVYRYVLQNKDKNFVSINTELEFIQNYVFY